MESVARGSRGGSSSIYFKFQFKFCISSFGAAALRERERERERERGVSIMEGRQGQSQFRETEEATQTTADLTAFVLPKKDCKELLVWMASAIENDYSVLSKTSALQQEQVRVCSLEIPKSSEMMFENINSWSFDIFTINDDDLPKLVEKVFINLSIFEYCLLDLKKVRTFINCIMAQYRSYVPYHNFRHACDVLHAVLMTLGCIDYLGFPMYEATAVLLPSFRKDVLPNLMANRELWSSYSTTMPLMQVADRILVPLYPRMNLEDHSRPSEMVVVERARPPVLDGQSLRAENQSLEKIRQATVENSQGFKISHGLLPSFSSQERPVSLLFGTPVQNYLPKLDSNVKGNASLRSTSLKLNRLPSSRLSMMSRHSLDSLPIAESSIRSESSIVSSYGDGTLDSKRNSLESIEDIGRTGFWENIRSNSYSMWLNRALDSNIWMSINIPATLVAIFAGDFIRAVLPKKVDLYEEPIYFACLFLFLLELIILSIVKKGYFVSFSFWGFCTVWT
ncbi:hypothetical protein O6H91_19G076900 [Diphasiastrum complanatum]|uniref:Uncharacterized protein n=1 Tax=Diphasiastrum complanatum TaxID=34168 RepID=A0ACC2AWT2_DIPCM|nr:hypothetical protein O6H91_19G076900 [Diphasiastrum complanatum]